MAADILARLDGLAALARSAMAPEITEEASALRERVSDGRFFVAVLGQFKRGKSTLINALIGADVLPVGVPPVTSVVTIVRHGEPGARLRTATEPWRTIAIEELVDHVSEARNPSNREHLVAVEVSWPSPMLAGGLCLVDTPGLGSVFEANTAETRAFVPHIDAAILVVGGDPPISGDEATLLADVAARVDDVIVVLNKADRMPDADRAQARAFTEEVVAARTRGQRTRVLEVSALERVRGDVSPRDWPALVDGLARLAHDAGAGLVERAGWRGLAALADRLRRRLTEERAALLRPADESAARVVELQRCARDAEQALVELTHRFDAEEERLMGDLEVERVHFIAEAQPRAIAALDARRASDAGTSRRAALAAAQEIVEPIVAAWRIERGADAERRFSAIVERYVSEANAFLSRLRDAGGPLAAGLAESLPAPPPLHPRSGYHFQPVLTESSPRVGTRLLDAVRSSGRRRAVARRAAEAFVQRLLDVNSSRAIGDLVSRAVESRRAVEASVRRALRAVVVDGAAAAGRAREIQTRGADAVRAAVSALDEHLSAIAAFDE